jgi:hypothetical protein
MKPKTWIIGVVAIVGFVVTVAGTAAVGLVAYAAIGPYRVMKNLGDSIAASDLAAVADCVDFVKLRRSLTMQVKESVKQRRCEGDRYCVAIYLGFFEQRIESFLTPAGVLRLLAGEPLEPKLDDSLDVRAANLPHRLAHAKYSFQSLSQFDVTFEPYLGLPLKVAVHLERQGLNWKMTGATRLE